MELRGWGFFAVGWDILLGICEFLLLFLLGLFSFLLRGGVGCCVFCVFVDGALACGVGGVVIGCGDELEDFEGVGIFC